MKHIGAVLALGVLAAGCTAIPQGAPAGRVPPPVRPSYTTAGLERVLGQHAQALVRLFGEPDADLEEGVGRKMQFASPICVLDAYLYPRQGGGVPVVTHIDARQRDGSPIDRASCVAALTRREGGR